MKKYIDDIVCTIFAVACFALMLPLMLILNITYIFIGSISYICDKFFGRKCRFMTYKEFKDFFLDIL
ncbi:hypothetical protein [Leuconostoc gasicomitatum]|uniref:hypothetical protein n=1 Tax=Leuconostoc gasicomitatum TaxID=115778 RepID=UPI001CC82811|nr:hypothetical protein [Leuconostoc gasicomitatum]MBZ5998524.1 hypothetical protein [Leuconostoc gasicomitatum]